MLYVTRAANLLFLLVMPGLLMGCGGSKTGDPELMRRQNDLSQIYELYCAAVKNLQKPPKQLADVSRKTFEPIYPEAIQALRSGKYTIVWGTTASEDSNAVLAYEVDVPKNGGMVLLANGNVEKMTADQFNAALKAKG